MKRLGMIVLVAGLVPFGVAAQPACYVRTYSAAHLDAHPGQGVAEIRALHVPASEDMFEYYDMRIRFRDDERVFTASPFCTDLEEGYVCAIECDGGLVAPSIDAQGRLVLRTDYLRAETGGPGDGCAGPVTRTIADADPSGRPVMTTFLLEPQELAYCKD